MELISLVLDKKFIKCQTFTSEDNIIEFSEHNISSEVIEVIPFPYPPYIVYTERGADSHSVLQIQCCGPLLTIVKEFAKLIKVNLKVLRQMTEVEKVAPRYVERGGSGLPHIALLPIDSTQYGYLKIELEPFAGENERWLLSRYVAFKDSAKILSITIKSEWSLYSQFGCFDIDVYYAIIASIIAIAVTMGLKNKSIHSFLSSLWNYTSLVLSDSYAMSLSKAFDRAMGGLWLIACTVLLSAFSGQLYTLLVRAQPINVIDSWDDLYSKPEWKHLKIDTFMYQNMHHFVDTQSYVDDMAQDFLSRFNNFYDPFAFAKGQKNLQKDLDLSQLLEGRSVYSADDIFMQFFEWRFEGMSLKKDIDFHISNTGNGVQPYFLLTNSANFNATLRERLNYVIRCLSESGVYDQEFEHLRKAFGVESYIQESYEYNDISISHTKATFYLFFYAQVLAFILFAVELFISFLIER